MLKRRLVAAGAITGALVLLPAAGAFAASSAITNGDFEADAVGSSTITGWTPINGLINLGVTQIAGCTTVDTTDYAHLRDFADEAEGVLGTVPVGDDDAVINPETNAAIYLDSSGAIVPANTPGAYLLHYGSVEEDWNGHSWTDFYIVDENTGAYRTGDTYYLVGTNQIRNSVRDNIRPIFSTIPDPTVRGDDVSPADDSTYWDDEPEFSTSLTDEVYDDDQEDWVPAASQSIELQSDLEVDTDDGHLGGYIAHGHAIYSDVFNVAGPRTISVDWKASALEDDFHVFGYLVNTATCAQTELLDATGRAQDWTTAQVNLTAPGQYRFVFVSGTYDQSWGGAAGALLNIDNIRSTPVLTGTDLALDLDLDLGQPVANASVQLSGGGLKANTAWTATMHSTPVVLATGTTDAQGNFWQLGNLPSSVEAGQHTVTLTGTAPDGTVLTRTAYITVSATGTLAYFSTTAAEGAAAAPAPALAATGANATPLWLAAIALVLGGGLVSALAAFRRRRGARAS